LLKLLGDGAEGKVWWACNLSYQQCALKIYRVPPVTSPKEVQGEWKKLEDVIELELKIWKEVFGVTKGIFMVKNENDDIRRVIGDLNGGPAIVMPILELVTNDMNTTGSGRPRLAQSQRTAVSNAIKVYTTAGYSSNDFKWAHVGFLDEKATLFDTRPTLTPNPEAAATKMRSAVSTVFPGHDVNPMRLATRNGDAKN